MPVVESTWTRSGYLTSLDPSSAGGVYLFVYEGQRPRIIYVGTAGNFSRRWSEHLDLFRCGGRTVWRPDHNEDPYFLMTQLPAMYASLAAAGKVWIPSSLRRNGMIEPLYEGSPPYDEWAEWVQSEYLSRIAVWRCELETDLAAKILESQIQSAFETEYSIKFYRQVAGQSWLGKQEIRGVEQLASIEFRFEDIPELTPSARALLSRPHNVS